MDSKSPLQIQNLSKFYGNSVGVKNLSLEIKNGEVFGFLGPNGAGKTTTIRTILNFLFPSSGKIKVFGMDSVLDSIEIKKKVGYLAGDIALYDNMTGEELLKYLTSLGRNTDWNHAYALALRFQANLKRKLKTLSKGNKQKIGLIQAFMTRGDLLILDEPTSGLDPLMQNEFYELVLESKKGGKTIFLSSHNLNEVQKICDRAGFIRNGELITVTDVSNMQAKGVQNYEVVFRKPPKNDPFSKIAGVQSDISGNRGTFRVEGDITPFLRELAKSEVTFIDRLDTSLEEVFMKYYQGEKNV